MDMALSKWIYLILAFLFLTPNNALNPSLNQQELSQIPLKFLNSAKKPELVDYIVNIRRRIREYPELGFEEVETSKLIRSELDKLGIDYKHPIAVTGIVGYIGTGDPPFVALRADMDPLVIEEGVEWKHKSKVPGKMHACGHDGHVAMLLGAAKMLQEHRHDLKGTVVLVFQPAEEGGGGAKKMVEAGILENVSAIFGMHLSGSKPLGIVAGTAGPILAGAGFFEAAISGKGGPAAVPQYTIDPVLAASNVILSLQHLVSRETDPLDSQVVTVAKFQGGGALNVIPDSVTIGGTFRTFSKKSMIQLKQRIEEVITKQAAVQRCSAAVNFDKENMAFYPPTVNDKDLHEFFLDAVADMLGAKNVLEAKPVMGTEDFAFFADVIPGYFYWVGMQNETEGPLGRAHSPYYELNEDALPYGAALHAALATRYLFKLQSGSKYPQGNMNIHDEL